jgi:membrane associated rhomboid family serine protease
MFIHGDIMLLVGNMFMLWALVSTLENAMGSVNFLCYYLLWGVVAGLSHAGMNWGEKLPMIGASGAIAGMLGCYFVLFGALAKIRSILWIWFRIYKINVPAGVYALVWLLLQFASIDLAAKVGDDHVAYWAHVGGFATGALIGLFLRADVHSRLALNREGMLEFKDERTMAMEAERLEMATNGSEATPATAKEPPVCPHCGTLVTEEHRIAETMFRCPKEGCKRLVFMQ